MTKKMKFETDTTDYIECTIYKGYMYNPKKGTVINAKDYRLIGTLNKDGYISSTISGKSVRLHRLIWSEAHKNEEIKKGEDIDHINAIRSDNKLSNLQKITHQKNLKKSAKERDYSFTKNNHKNKHYVLEKCLKTGIKKLYGSLNQVHKHRNEINSGSVKFCCEKRFNKVVSKKTGKTYEYKYITKEKYDTLKDKYKCYEKVKFS